MDLVVHEIPKNPIQKYLMSNNRGPDQWKMDNCLVSQLFTVITFPIDSRTIKHLIRLSCYLMFGRLVQCSHNFVAYYTDDMTIYDSLKYFQPLTSWFTIAT